MVLAQVPRGLELSEWWGEMHHMLALGRGGTAITRMWKSGKGMGGTSFSFSVCSPCRFSLKFKGSDVAVTVIQGSGGSGMGKLIFKKKGSNSLEVTVQ